MVSWNGVRPFRSRPLTRLSQITGIGLETSPRSRQWERRGRQFRYKLQIPVCSALAIMLFCAASMNAGFAADSAGPKGKADAAGDKSVGTKSDSGGAHIRAPEAGSAGATGPHAGTKGTDTRTGVERGTVTRGPSDSGTHTGNTNSEGTGARSNAERGVDTSATSDRGTQALHNETPLDLRITVLPLATSKNTTKVPDWTKIIAPPNNLRDHPQTLAPRMKVEMERNAIGILIPRKFAPIGVDGIPRSTASAAIGNLSSVGRPDVGPLVSSPAPTVRNKTNGPMANTATKPSSLDGSGIGHPGAGTGAIGGPAKSVAGINGTSFRAKHP